MKIGIKLSNIIYQIYIVCLYIPVYFRLFWYCLKYRVSPTILRKVNPSFPYGGLLASKSLIRDHFQVNKKEFDKYFCKTLFISTKDSYQEKIHKAQLYIKEHQLKYPFVLKPNEGVGGMGLLFIENENILLDALQSIKKAYILQEYIVRPLELSVFFVKHPWQDGKIRSITRRYTIKKDSDPELMIPTRKIIYKDESVLINSVLEERFASISDIPGFCFGRFDIRVQDIDAFVTHGTWFKIMEVNVGVHSMAIHAFDSKYGRIKRYKILFDQLYLAFAIARKNVSASTPYPAQNIKAFLQWFRAMFKSVY